MPKTNLASSEPAAWRPRALLLGGLAWAVGASLLLLWVPVYASVDRAVWAGADGRPTGHMTRSWGSTLADVNGPDTYLALAVPILLTAVPLLVRRGRAGRAIAWLSGALLAGFVLLAGFTIGLVYAPSAVAVLFAASRASAWPTDAA